MFKSDRRGEVMQLFDLTPEDGMHKEVGVLYATVKDTYVRLKHLCKDMNQDELEYKGPNQMFNSTAQLLRHLAVVDLHWVYRLKGEDVPERLLQKYGPMIDDNGSIPDVRGITLEELIHQYDEVQEMFKETCKQLATDDLEKKVVYEKGAFAR